MSEEYFALAGAWKVLSESAFKHDKEAFHRAAGYLDVQTTETLRGLAYLTHRLSLIPEDGINPQKMNEAVSAVADVMALVVAMLDHQEESKRLDVTRQGKPENPIDGLAEKNARMRGDFCAQEA